MKPVGITFALVCLSSLVVGGVVLAAPDVSPVWTVGALALLAGALVVGRSRRKIEPAEARRRGRVVFEKRIRFSTEGFPDEPRRSGGQPEILLRIVDARGSYIRTSGSRPQPLNRKGSHIL